VSEEATLFPFRDHNPSSRFPYVSYALIAINVIVFLLYGFRDEQFQWNVYMDWALVPAEVTAGDELFTFITAMFMHGGIMHLAGNMLFLYVFGDNLEEWLSCVVPEGSRGLHAHSDHNLQDDHPERHDRAWGLARIAGHWRGKRVGRTGRRRCLLGPYRRFLRRDRVYSDDLDRARGASELARNAAS